MAGNVLIKNANGNTITLQNPDTNVSDVVVDTSKIMQKVTSTDNAVVRFNGTTGKVQDSNVIVDDKGNVGIGGSPSPLGTGCIGANIGDNGELFSSSISTFLANNLYYDGANYRYKKNGTASVVYQNAGQFVFANAVSGVAGAIATLRSAVLSANHDLILGDATLGGSRYLVAQSGTLANGEYAYLNTGGGTAGAINRNGLIGVYKHSSIVNACSFIGLSTQSGASYNYWTDDVGNLRISGTNSHIGTTNGTVVGTQTSDERVKNIVGTCPYGLQEILELETYKYSMKDDVEGSYKLGFVAQQAMGVIPESVYDTNERLTEPVTVIKQKIVKEAVKDDEGNILEAEITEDYEDIEYQETSDAVTKLAMDYQMMIPVLVNAMKEQQAMIETLKQEVAILKGVN